MCLIVHEILDGKTYYKIRMKNFHSIFFSRGILKIIWTIQVVWHSDHIDIHLIEAMNSVKSNTLRDYKG